MTVHTHLTRDMKPLGECPARDEYHRYSTGRGGGTRRSRSRHTAGQAGGLAVALIIGLCLLAGAFAVWFAIWLSQILTTNVVSPRRADRR